MYIDGVSKLKLIFGPLNIYKLKMFSKSCNLVFFLFFFLFGEDFTDFFGCFFFSELMSKAQVFQMFLWN